MSNSISIKAPEDIERETVIICAPWSTPLLMPDNRRDVCSQCGRIVQYRPNVRPDFVKLCIECALPMMERDAADNELHIFITPESIAELCEQVKKQRH